MRLRDGGSEHNTAVGVLDCRDSASCDYNGHCEELRRHWVANKIVISRS